MEQSNSSKANTWGHNIWAIGDVQGCNVALQKLLNHQEIVNNENTKFWFCGDLINRGPNSLEVLRTVIDLKDKAITVLGNHDLHFLGVVAGLRRPGQSDTLEEILNSSDLQFYVDWYRNLPLAHFENNHLLVHAGVLPQWDLKKALGLAQEVQDLLRSPNWAKNIQNMYGNQPTKWSDNLKGSERLRMIVNVFTRMRMCSAQGDLEFKYKGEPVTNENHMPWFEVPNRKTQNNTVVFGHWSALGLLIRSNLIGLDTGCVWGRKLTAVRLSDKKVVQIPCS